MRDESLQKLESVRGNYEGLERILDKVEGLVTGVLGDGEGKSEEDGDDDSNDDDDDDDDDDDVDDDDDGESGEEGDDL